MTPTFTRRRAAALALSAAGALALGPRRAAAEAKTPVDLELVLLGDATGSIDDAEIRFQRSGYVKALSDPVFVRVMTSGQHGKVALTYVEWGQADSQDVVVPWTAIDGPAAAAGFAAKLTAAPRRARGRNAIGSALMKGIDLIEGGPFAGTRRVIDFAGDSANSWDPTPISAAKARAEAAKIDVNGLAILCRTGGCGGRPVLYDLEARFREEIIAGPNAFVVTADGPDTFADAVRRKLFLEVSGATRARPIRG